MAKAVRSGLGIASLVLIAGSIVLMFFVVLSGVTNSRPLRDTYFLRVDSSSFPGTSRPVSQWTYFYICGEGNRDCGAPVPALPFGYAWRDGTQGVPTGLTGRHGGGTTSTYYYYMWRFGWVLYLLALVFNVGGFFLSLLAPFSRLASAFSGLITAFALFWFSIAASLMTATFVKARNEFRDEGISASIGRYAFGFTWGAWAAMFLAMLLLFIGWRSGRSDYVGSGRKSGFLGRKRSRRSNRGSLVETESQRRVKDEYS